MLFITGSEHLLLMCTPTPNTEPVIKSLAKARDFFCLRGGSILDLTTGLSVIVARTDTCVSGNPFHEIPPETDQPTHVT